MKKTGTLRNDSKRCSTIGTPVSRVIHELLPFFKIAYIKKCDIFAPRISHFLYL